MSAAQIETLELANSVARSEKYETVLVGDLYYPPFGNRTANELENLKPLIDMAHKCITAPVSHGPERMAAVRRVIARLRQAQQTPEGLQGLPD